MDPKVKECLEIVITNWQRMQSSDMDDAEEDANRFEGSFYKFIEQFKSWVENWAEKPNSLDQALSTPEIQDITDQLPPPLHLPFETELELILEGITREVDDKYD